MEHLLQKSKCAILYNNFKYMLFQRRQKALLRSNGLTSTLMTIYLTILKTINYTETKLKLFTIHFTLVQKVKHSVYKFMFFLNAAILCGDSGKLFHLKMTCTSCTDEVREKVPSF